LRKLSLLTAEGTILTSLTSAEKFLLPNTCVELKHHFNFSSPCCLWFFGKTICHVTLKYVVVVVVVVVVLDDDDDDANKFSLFFA